MQSTHKVIWTEGAMLSQQHLQYLDKAIENEIYYYRQAINKHHWGIIDIVFDKSSLELGSVSVLNVNFIMQNGRVIQYNDKSKPLVCHFDKNINEKIEIFLTLPTNEKVDTITGYKQQLELSQWRAEYRIVKDKYDEEREQEILLGSPNLRLETEKNKIKSDFYIKIASVEKDNHDIIRFDDNFIYPCVHMVSSESLVMLLNKMIQFVTDLNYKLSKSYYANIQKESLLNIIYSTLSELRIMKKNLTMHPYEFYKIIVNFYLQYIYRLNLSQNPIPSYDHLNINLILNYLINNIQSIASAYNPQEIKEIDLIREDNNLYKVSNIDESFFKSREIYLCVKSQEILNDWAKVFCTQVKIASEKTVSELIKLSLPGVEFIHSSSMPDDNYLKKGYEYFKLNTEDPLWGEIVQERNITIFLNDQFDEKIKINLVSFY